MKCTTTLKFMFGLFDSLTRMSKAIHRYQQLIDFCACRTQFAQLTVMYLVALFNEALHRICSVLL